MKEKEIREFLQGRNRQEKIARLLSATWTNGDHTLDEAQKIRTLISAGVKPEEIKEARRYT